MNIYTQAYTPCTFALNSTVLSASYVAPPQAAQTGGFGLAACAFGHRMASGIGNFAALFAERAREAWIPAAAAAIGISAALLIGHGDVEMAQLPFMLMMGGGLKVLNGSRGCCGDDGSCTPDTSIDDDEIPYDVHGMTALGLKEAVEGYHDSEIEFQRTARSFFTTDAEVERVSETRRDGARKAFTNEYEGAIDHAMAQVAPGDEVGGLRSQKEADAQRGVLGQIHGNVDDQGEIEEKHHFTIRPLIADDSFESGVGRYTYRIKCRRLIPSFSIDGMWVLDELVFVSKEEETY